MTVGVLESHSGENIIDKINDIILSFQIPSISHINDIFFSISHDNCPKIVKGIREYTSIVSTRCGCHTVQLTPHVLDRGSSKNPRNNFILEASEIFHKARTVVGHFHPVLKQIKIYEPLELMNHNQC